MIIGRFRFMDVPKGPICAAGQHSGGCSVLLAVAHPFIQLAHMPLWGRNASLEIGWLSHNREHTD